MRIFAISIFLSLSVQTLCAQIDTASYVSTGDTIRYVYSPAPETVPDAGADTLRRRKPFFRRVVDYFGESSRDKTMEKKIDITFIGGISYSQTTSLGFALMAAGQYRLDRTDSVTQPSNVSLYGNVSLTGFYAVGVSGSTFFRHRGRLTYDLQFSSQPTDFWGIGYENARRNPRSDFVRKRVIISARYSYPVAKNTYVGASADLNFTRGINFSAPGYLPAGEKNSYTAAGFGLIAEYDSRDYITGPSKGAYLSVCGKIYPKGLGNCGASLYELVVQADCYQALWKDATLAVDLYGEMHNRSTPWFMLSKLGGSYRMRGYYEGRYMDNDMITVQIELRQRIWRRIGAVAWGGAGNVFPSFGKFDLSHTLPNYGIGLRWEFKHRVNVRVDYGFGRKTSGVVLNINEAF